MPVIILGLVLLWLWALHRKMVRLAHQRQVHFDRLVVALERRRTLVARMSDTPLPKPPPFDEKEIEPLVAYESEMGARAHALRDVAIDEIEREIGSARNLFNEATMAINVRVDVIPTAWFARLMGYGPAPYFTPSATQ